MPKPDGGVRWLTDLVPAGLAAYRAAVTPFVPLIERSLGAEVLANRAQSGSDGWRLAPWRPARRRWRRLVAGAARVATPGTVFATADVRDCYGSVGPDTVSSAFGTAAAELVAFLRRLVGDGVRGLPIGPDPSAVLANAILAHLDDAVRSTGADHLRWVDDLVLWGSRREVIRGLDALHHAAAELRLELHPEKTRILDGPDALSERRCSLLGGYARAGVARFSSPQTPIIGAP